MFFENFELLLKFAFFQQFLFDLLKQYKHPLAQTLLNLLTKILSTLKLYCFDKLPSFVVIFCTDKI